MKRDSGMLALGRMKMLSERMFARAERMRKRGRRAYAMFLRRDAKKVAQLEAENEALSNLLSSLVDVELERDVAMSENQRLTKHVEDYEAENAALKLWLFEDFTRSYMENNMTQEEAEHQATMAIALLTAEEDDDETQ